jgi:hypothetical protein
MTCKNCPYTEVDIDCGEKVYHCSLQGSDPAEYPEGCYKAVRREEE